MTFWMANTFCIYVCVYAICEFADEIAFVNDTKHDIFFFHISNLNSNLSIQIIHKSCIIIGFF